MAITNYNLFIEIHPEVRFGKPVIIGTRITVYDILGWLANGQDFSEILADFPQLKKEHIQACLAYAADKERRLKIA